MSNKLLIAVVLLTIALVTYSATTGVAAFAIQAGVAVPQEVRPVPAVPNIESAGGEQPAQSVTEEFHQTYPLSATGRISLGNINGGVKIKVWDRAAVQVDAIKKAYRRERLAEARIEVTSTEENIRIKTEYPEENQNFRNDERRYENPAIVEYSLTVPRKATLESIELVNGQLDIEGVEGNVKASSINGPVTVSGLIGEARLSTVNGPLKVVFRQLDESKTISLGSVNGHVTLVIPSDSNASIRAGTVHGAISNDFGMKVKHGEYVGHNLEGQIGSGGPRIKVGNVNGGIHITHAQDGRPLSQATSIAGSEGVKGRAAIEADLDREVELTTAEITLAKIDSARLARETRQAQREAQRQVDAAMRQAQREIEQAQRQIQRQRVRVQPRPVINQNRPAHTDWNKSSQEVKSFPVSGSPRVSITTFDGPVTVRGWDQPEVRYTATKRAADDESLKRISIQADQQGQSITISINPVNEEVYNGSVSLEVNVPRTSSLHVTSGDGPLTLEGVSGDITLRSGDGPITVNNSGGQLHVNTGDGPIQINKFDGQVDARTGDGPIALDGNFNALSARTGDGEISLSVPAGSSFTIETNAPEGISNEGFEVAEDVTLSPRVKRWRVGNGGRVFILRTGEGKVSLRPRN